MRPIGRPSRVARKGLGRWAALLLATLLAWCSATGLSPRTPEGVQCPTAVTQFVRVAVRNCCGHIVGTEVRKPKPGEQGFLQCRCAEKRAAGHEIVSGTSLLVPECVPPAPLTLVLPIRLAENPVECAYIARPYAIPAAPAVRPPLVG